jgi:broad specificity phosphatase PhoE
MRHGETESNRRGVYAGRSAEPLSPAGRSQVEALLDELEPLGLRRVVSSPVRRALETAEIIAGALALPLATDVDLTEMELGPWTGLTEEEVEARFPGEHALWRARSSELRLPGREPLGEVRARALRSVARAVQGPVPSLLVTHVAIVRCVLLTLAGRSLDEYKQIDVPNCGLFAVRGEVELVAAKGTGSGGAVLRSR